MVNAGSYFIGELGFKRHYYGAQWLSWLLGDRRLATDSRLTGVTQLLLRTGSTQ